MPVDSYLSQSASTLTFGLGEAQAVEALSVRWSDGTRVRFEALPVNRRLRLWPAE
jgi:hypothetical protein